MYRTTITPLNTDIHLSLPQSYLGKEIEVIFFAKDEMQGDAKVYNSLAGVKGILSANEALELINQIEKSRNEWDNNI